MADTTNVAAAMGYNLLGDPVTDTASIFVNTVQVPGPDGGGIIALEKVASAPAVYVSETVVYTYTVSNLSDDAVHSISLSDDHLGDIAPPFDLAAGESTSFVTSTVLLTDTTNVATAMGYNLLEDTVQAQTSAFVGVVPLDVALSLRLTASAPRVYKGDTVTYTYVISNVGSDIAYNVVLTDNWPGIIAGPFDLAGGENATYSVSYELDEDTTNVATATGEDALGRPLTATADVDVDTIMRPDPDGGGILSLSVTPSATSVGAGTTVTYTYVVTNVSQDPVSNIVVEDDQFGYILPKGVVGAFDPPEGFTLEAGESRTLIYATLLYESTLNVAEACGEDLLGTVVSAEATAFVWVVTESLPHSVSVFLPIVFNNHP